MSGSAFDHPETTLVFDYPAGTVELYTTDRRAFLRAIKRNPFYTLAEVLDPGYRLVYPLALTRPPESILKPVPGGEQFVADHWLTDVEKQNRDAAATRLKAVRAVA